MTRIATPINGRPAFESKVPPARPLAVDADLAGEAIAQPKPLDEISIEFDGGPEASFNFWKNEIDRAHTKLDRKDREDEWDEILKYQKYKLDEIGRYNFVHPIIEDMHNEITGERPEITVKVKRESQVQRVPQMEALLSWDLDTKHGWDVVQRIVRDSAWFGIGWGKQVWTGGRLSLEADPGFTVDSELNELGIIDAEHQIFGFTFGKQPLPTRPTDIDWLHVERHRQHVANPLTPLEIRMALDAHIKEHEAQDAGKSNGSRSITKQVDPRNMLYDPDVDRWDDVRWVAERSVELIEDMKKVKEYNKGAVKGIAAVEDTIDKSADTDPDGTSPGTNNSIAVGPKWRVADVWRIYDVRNERQIIYCPQQQNKELLGVHDWAYRGQIYRPLVIMPISRQIEGVPVPRMLIPLHKDLAFVYDEHRKAIRKAPKQQRFLQKAAFSPDEQAAIKNGSRDDIFVDRLPRDAIEVVNPPTVNPEIYQFADRLFAEQNKAVRSSEVAQGVTGGAKFATEIDALLAAQGRSLRTLREHTKDWIEALKTTQLDQYHDFGTADLLMQVSGAQGIQFDPLSPDEIPLDAEVVVDLDSFSAVSKEVNKRLSRELMQLVTSVPQLMASFAPEGWVKFMGQLLRVHGVRDAESLLAPVQAAQMIQGLQEQVAGLPSFAPPTAAGQGQLGGAPPMGQGLNPQVASPGGPGMNVGAGLR